LDEGYEMITLVQTGKSRPRPIVLMEPVGSTYWSSWINFVKRQLVNKKFIKPEDLSLFKVVKSVDQAIDYIENFYRVYHSLRYVSGVAIIRLKRQISAPMLERINREFKDILHSGKIEVALPTAKEVQEKEFLSLPRLAMSFNLRDYGRLYEMIQVINQD